MNISDVALSKWHLALIFLAAVLLISLARLDVDGVVRNELDEISSQSGLQLDFDEVSFLALDAHFGHVSVSSARLPEVLIFEQVRLSPVWHSFLTGENAVDVDLKRQGDMVTATLTQADNKILLQHVRLEGDVGRLAKLMVPYLNTPFPVVVSGLLQVDGEIVLNRTSGVPEQGTLEAHWRGAKAGMMGAEFALGDLMMALQGEAGQWQWQLNDADVGMIDASGTLKQLLAPVAMWPVHGSVVIDITKIRDPYLVAWLPDMGDEKIVRLKISGTLSRPRLDRIK